MKKAISFLLMVVIITTVFAYTPSTEVAAKSKKEKAKTQTTATLSEEAAHFTIDTWKPTYSNWSKKEIEKADAKGTGKNLFDKYGDLYDLKLAKNQKFVNFACAIDEVTSGGYYGTLEDKGVVCKYLQDNIKTVADVWLYLTLARYSYNEDDLGNMGAAMQGWQTENSATINLLGNCGVCCHTATVVNYLLEGDYEETGFVTVHSTFGHQYAYVKDNGVYYFIDFTDYISSNGSNSDGKNYLLGVMNWKGNNWDGTDEKIREYHDYFDCYKDSICFWSGTSLDDPSATKAVLIHDTYAENNNRDHLDWNWNEENTSYIWATKYYAGMEGSNISFLVEDCNQSGKTLSDPDMIRIDGTSYKLEYLAVTHPEYTKYQTLYIDTTGKRYGSPFKEIAPIELRLVPFFCEVSPEAQIILDSRETYMERVQRQTKICQETHTFKFDLNDSSMTFGTSYHYNFSAFNKEIRIGSFWMYQGITDSGFYGCMNREQKNISHENFLKQLDIDDIYTIKLVKR